MQDSLDDRTEHDNTGPVEERGVRSASGTDTAPRISVTEHGPYRVEGRVAIYDAEGTLLRSTGTWCLCRCGGSRNKPFCDATHGLKGFDGAETADHGSIAERRDRYVADGITVFDDRRRCAHFGQCTDRLPAVFRADAEPFVDPHGAAPAGSPRSSPAARQVHSRTPEAATGIQSRSVPSPRSRRSSTGRTGCAARCRSSAPTAAPTSGGSARRCAAAGSRPTSRSVTAPTGTRGSATRCRPSWSGSRRRSTSGWVATPRSNG